MTRRANVVAPMLATLSNRVPTGDRWIFERKLDGIRLVARRDGDEVELTTRNGIDRSSSFPELADALRGQRQQRFVADGEVVAFDGPLTSFARLQQRAGLTDPAAIRSSGVAVHLYLFDLVELDDVDLRRHPLRERKAALRREIDFDDPLRFCEHRNGGDGTGATWLAEACDDGWEGLIAKRADSRYVGGRSRDWLKLKCVARQEFVIGGYTDPKGSRAGLGSLLVGYHRVDDTGVRHERLEYAGRVGTGFDERTLARLTSMLGPRTIAASPFGGGDDDDDDGGGDDPDLKGAAAAGVHWVTPDLVCEVGFTEWTRAGRLRHPRFLGLRDDKRALEVVREHPESAP